MGFLAQLGPGPLGEKMSRLLAIIRAILGPQGTLIVPTFTYSFCRSEAFDVKKSPSTVGAFTEFVRSQPDSMRSIDPIFSVSAIGAAAQSIHDLRNESCFGPGSIFDFLFRQAGKIVCCGCSLDRATFVHFVEQTQGVYYRYIKRFAGPLIDSLGVESNCHVDYYVRKLDLNFETNLGRLQIALEGSGKLFSGELGRFRLLSVGAVDFFEQASEMLKMDENSLVAFNK